jgi:hypothetical protein
MKFYVQCMSVFTNSDTVFIKILLLFGICPLHIIHLDFSEDIFIPNRSVCAAKYKIISRQWMIKYF